tara:strand:- start:724 stop:1536 length:813 start_codon:yes stop_codon:yes gene_type:complete
MAKTDLTVVIPVHTVEGDTVKWLEKAVESVKVQKVKPDALLIVTADDKEVVDTVNKVKLGSLDKITKVVTNDTGKTDFCSQVNFAVTKVETDYFSVLELDDEYSNIWVDNFVNYKKHYSDVSLFLPIVVDTDVSGRYINTTNEAVWALQFSDELGVLDNSSLIDYPNFSFTGGIMKKSDYLEVGGLKSSMRLTFIYEFLLRVTYNDLRVMTIPKFGLKHTNMRPGSLFHTYKSGETAVTSEEAKFWMDTAKKEYFFTEDREITFEEKATA